MKYRVYRLVMQIAHRYHWHYAPPIYPDGDVQLWCKWCGFRQTIKQRGHQSITHGANWAENTLQTSPQVSGQDGRNDATGN